MAPLADDDWWEEFADVETHVELLEADLLLLKCRVRRLLSETARHRAA